MQYFVCSDEVDKVLIDMKMNLMTRNMSVMLFLLHNKLGLGPLKPINMCTMLVDSTIRKTERIIGLKVDLFFSFNIDFMVMHVQEVIMYTSNSKKLFNFYPHVDP